MRQEPNPFGIALIFGNCVLAATTLLELHAVQDLLGAPDADWQGEYDSGTMAFASMPLALGLLLTSLLVLITAVPLIARRQTLPPLGWAAFATHVLLLAAIWHGPAAPASTTDYWIRLTALIACAATGFTTGVTLRHRPMRSRTRRAPAAH